MIYFLLRPNLFSQNEVSVPREFFKCFSFAHLTWEVSKIRLLTAMVTVQVPQKRMAMLGDIANRNRLSQT